MTKTEFPASQCLGTGIVVKLDLFLLKRIKQCECLTHLNLWSRIRAFISAIPIHGVICVKTEKNESRTNELQGGGIEFQCEFHLRKDEKDKLLHITTWTTYLSLSYTILGASGLESQNFEGTDFFFHYSKRLGCLQTVCLQNGGNMSPVSRLTWAVSPTHLCYVHLPHPQCYLNYPEPWGTNTPTT